MIQLTHIAENLIAEMYNRSAPVRKLFINNLDTYDINQADSKAVPELQLSVCGQYQFDGAHKVDVAILDKKKYVCIPCEAKLGKDRLGKSEFEKRFLKPCHPSHGGKRLAGSMLAILDGKLPANCQKTPLLTNFMGKTYDLSAKWFLIVRRNTLKSWDKNGQPSLSSNCIIIAFEDLVDLFGGVKEFNALVKELFEFDYYENWIN